MIHIGMVGLTAIGSASRLVDVALVILERLRVGRDGAIA